MPKSYSFRLLKYLVFPLGFFLLSCSTSHSEVQGAVFRYNEFRNITSLDPAFARNPQNIWPINQLFNGLVQLDNQLGIQAEIAKSWVIDKSGVHYTFYLRNDVFFHPSVHFGDKQSRPVTAHDFVYSFDRLKDPQLASPGSWVLNQVEHYEAVNDSTLNITLRKPFPAFLGLLSMRYCAVVPKEVVEALGDGFRNQPIGTGPFYFKRWEENVKLVLRKNTAYFEKDNLGNQLPYLEAIAIQFIPDIQSEFMLFLQGKLDFINSLDSSYKDELLTPSGALQPKYKNRIQMQKGPYLNTEYLGFYLDNDNPALQSVAIREAINIGFDRNKMVAYLRNNIGYPAKKGFIPKGLLGTSDRAFLYDPNRARQLVQTYIKEHSKMPELNIATDANYLDICEFIQGELQKIGIKINIDVMPTANLRQAKSSGKLEMFRASWIADYPDAENYLSLFYSRNHSPEGPNYTHFSDRLFDRWYNQALETVDLEHRTKIYQSMDSLALTQFPIVPLYYDQVIRFLQKDIKGMEINPINTLVLKNVRK